MGEQPEQTLKQLRVFVHNYYKQFGPQACNTIINQIVAHGGAGKLLVAMGQPDPEYFEDQHLALRNFLRHYGLDGFKQALASGGKAQLIPQTARGRKPWDPPEEDAGGSEGLKNLMGLDRKAREEQRAREREAEEAEREASLHDNATVIEEDEEDEQPIALDPSEKPAKGIGARLARTLGKALHRE